MGRDIDADNAGGTSATKGDLLVECDRFIAEHKKKADANERRARWASWLLVGSTAAIPVFIVASTQTLDFVFGKLIPAVLAAISAAIAGLLQFERPHERWSLYRRYQRWSKLSDSSTSKGPANTRRPTATCASPSGSPTSASQSTTSGRVWYQQATRSPTRGAGLKRTSADRQDRAGTHFATIQRGLRSALEFTFPRPMRHLSRRRLLTQADHEIREIHHGWFGSAAPGRNLARESITPIASLTISSLTPKFAHCLMSSVVATTRIGWATS